MTETLAEIEGVFDRLAHWVTSHPREFLGGVGAVLAVTAGAGLIQWNASRTALQAAEAVAQVSDAYFRAMGAQPGTTTFAEPANPETARSVREEYAGRLTEAAASHGGTAAAVDAWLLAGTLHEELGEEDAALDDFRRAVGEASEGSSLRGVGLVRLAGALEERGEFEEAARSWEEASGVPGFPMRRWALAFAARDWSRAGDHERAVALADRLDAEPAAGPGSELPGHVEAEMAELRLRR